jgi:hypothetical protein
VQQSVAMAERASQEAPSSPQPLSSIRGGVQSPSSIFGHFSSIANSIQRRLSSGFGSSPSSPSSSYDEGTRPHHHEVDNPPLSAIHLEGFKSSTTERILTERMAEEIRLMLPAKHQLPEQWDLVYSLDQHGVSLATLYARSKAYNSPHAGFIVAVKDQEQNVFGAYLSDYPHIHPYYYGTGECFLYKFSSVAINLGSSQFSEHIEGESHDRPSSAGHSSSAASQLSLTVPPRPSSAHSTDSHFPYQFRGFSYTGLNDYMILCTPQFLSVGGGYIHNE